MRFPFWILLLHVGPLWAGPLVYFPSSASLEREIARRIDSAFLSIEVAVFDFSSPRLARALERAQRRGVRVRVVIDSGQIQTPARTPWRRLAPGAVRTMGGRKRGLMHHKFAIFDDEIVITGSYNWTLSAEHSNFENLLVEEDRSIAVAYSRQFETLWRLARDIPAVPSRRVWGGSDQNRKDGAWTRSQERRRRYSGKASATTDQNRGE